MKKPWSISTTVRNPDRIRSFLQVVKDFEGVEFDQDQQIKFQIALIQKRLYKPTGLDNKLAKYYDSVSDMSIKHAQEIFKHMTNKSSVLKDDPGFRGRTSIAPLSKMGLVVSKKTISKLYLTNFGKRFLKEDFDIVHTHVFGHAHVFFASLAAKLKNSKLIHTTHCPWTTTNRSLLGKILLKPQKINLRENLCL